MISSENNLICLSCFSKIISVFSALYCSNMYKPPGITHFPAQPFHYGSRHVGPSQTPPSGPGPAPTPHPGVDSAHGPSRAPVQYGLISDLPLPVPTGDSQVHSWWMECTSCKVFLNRLSSLTSLPSFDSLQSISLTKSDDESNRIRTSLKICILQTSYEANRMPRITFLFVISHLITNLSVDKLLPWLASMKIKLDLQYLIPFMKAFVSS